MHATELARDVNKDYLLPIVTVLGLNLLGDGLRDWLDPRIRVARA